MFSTRSTRPNPGKTITVENNNSERRNAARRRLLRRRFRVLPRLRAYFFAGVLVTTPLAVTYLVAAWFIEMVDSYVKPMIPEGWNPDHYLKDTVGLEVGLPGLGLLILFVFMTLIGALAAGFLGRIVIRFGESILGRMPVIRSVYSAIKQILETILKQQSDAFRHAVLVEYPRRGVWTIGFITGETEGEVQNLVREKLVNVYVPTTPNPTSGFLLYVPRTDIVELSMSVEEAVKMVVSVGLVTPPDRRSLEKQNTPVLSADRHDGSDIPPEKEGR